ncbi:UNVERIFIED_CONTAM: hypothetical protein NCL1_55419 [Trichonephila clavipes]
MDIRVRVTRLMVAYDESGTVTADLTINLETGSRVFSLICLLGSLGSELMATLFQSNQEVKREGKTQIRKLLNNRSLVGANEFNVLPEVYFSGSENANEFLEGIDNQIRLHEIPSDLSCAYLKGHLLRRAQDWYQIFGSKLVQNTATDFAQLKAALSKAFSAIRNKKDLEIKSFMHYTQQRRGQEPTGFIYDLFKLHKQLELGMSEEALVDHIFVRLEQQVEDYVEVRNPQKNGPTIRGVIKV